MPPPRATPSGAAVSIPVGRRVPAPPGPPPLTFWTRLHFGWTVLWGGVVTLPLAFGLIVHNLVRPTARTFKWWMTGWSRLLLFGAGIRVTRECRARLSPEQPVVLVANHQSSLDIVTCAAAIPHPYGFAAKAALRRTPVVGAVIARSACVFVDRSSARRAVESVREAAALIAEGNSVLIYPEGERTYRPALAPFLRGAFLLAVEAGVPIVPVTQIGNHLLFDERRRVSRPGRVHLVVGEPIPTAGLTRADLPALEAAARDAIERELSRFHGTAIGAGETPSVSSPAP